MKPIVRSLIAVVVSFIRSRVALQVEVVALRHQLTVYQRSARRPAIHPTDRILWHGWLAMVPVAGGPVRCSRRPSLPGSGTLSRALGPTSGRWGAPRSAGKSAVIRDISMANRRWGAPRYPWGSPKLGIAVAKSTHRGVNPRASPATVLLSWRVFLTWWNSSRWTSSRFRRSASKCSSS